MISKQKCFSIVLLLMLVNVIFIVPSSVPLVNEEIEEKIVSPDNLLIDPISNEISPLTSTKQSIDYDTIYQGESVKTEIEFNKQSFTFPEESVWHRFGGYPYINFHDIHNFYVDDSANGGFYIEVQDGSASSDRYVYFYLKLYCGGTGTIYLDWQGFGQGTVRGNTFLGYQNKEEGKVYPRLHPLILWRPSRTKDFVRYCLNI